jgi:2-amino-4-hydroxy-6-hydroxymethyldihydropteridine diphosphokinase
MQPTVTAYIALGSNLGERAALLAEAVRQLDADPAIEVSATSPVYESEAMTAEDEEQPPFLNAVVRVETSLAPEDLFMACMRVEAAAGRERKRRWEPRRLDLDLLLYGDRVVETDVLTIPHPGLLERRFVLQPLVDLAPDLEVPFTSRRIADILAECTDRNMLRLEPVDLMPRS